MQEPAQTLEPQPLVPVVTPAIEVPPEPPRPPRAPRPKAPKSDAPGSETPTASNVAPAGLTLEVVRDRATLRTIEPAWQELADEACEPNPYYEPWAVLPALEAFGGNVDFVCVFRPHPSLRKGERQLCGLFPVERRRASGPLAVPMLSLWRHPYSYLGAPLVRAGLERETLACFLDWLAAGGWQRGLLRIEDLPGDGALRIALVDELCARGWSSAVTQTYSRAFFRRDVSAEAYLERVVPGKKRKELRRQLQRLTEQGACEFSELQPLDDPRAWAKEFVALERRGWKGQHEVAIASEEAHVRYFTELVRHASLRSRMMGLTLRLNGQPVAMKLNLLSKRGGMAFKITYDEAWARFSPGVLLEIDNLHRLHQRDDVPWMDSCAAPNRAMINRLWGDRREMQTLLIATDHTLASLVVSAMPLVRWASRRLRAARPQESSHER